MSITAGTIFHLFVSGQNTVFFYVADFVADFVAVFSALQDKIQV